MGQQGYSWNDVGNFAERLRDRNITSPAQLAEAFLWYRSHCNDLQDRDGMKASELAHLIEDNYLGDYSEAFGELSGLPSLRTVTINSARGGYVIRRALLHDLDAGYLPIVGAPPKVPIGGRQLITEIKIDDNTLFGNVYPSLVEEANACYSMQLANACAVLCRRLIECLFVKVFDDNGYGKEIRNKNGWVIRFSDLINKAKTFKCDEFGQFDQKVIELAEKVIDPGNAAAHSPIYKVEMNDIEHFKPLLNRGIAELLHMAKVSIKND